MLGVNLAFCLLSCKCEKEESLYVSSFQFLISKNAIEGTVGLWEVYSSLFLCLPLFLFEFFLCKKNLQTAARPKTTSIGCLPLGNFSCPLFCEEFGTKAALLSSASCLCVFFLNAQSNGRMYPRGVLVPPGG